MRGGKNKAPFCEVNMVPYLDVMLVLLIIFMVVTPALHMGVDIDLPRASTNELVATKDTPVVVSVDAKGQKHVQYGEQASQAISTQHDTVHWFKTKNIGKDATVLIRADRTLMWEKVMQVMSELQALGFSKVTLMTEKNEAG